MVLPLTGTLLVANSTPMVDLDSKLNSSRVNLPHATCIDASHTDCAISSLGVDCSSLSFSLPVSVGTYRESRFDLPTPESPISTTAKRTRAHAQTPEQWQRQ